MRLIIFCFCFLFMVTVSAQAQTLEVIGGCYSQPEQYAFLDADIDSSIISDTEYSMVIANYSKPTCENLQSIDQFITYTGITLGIVDGIIFAGAKTELLTLIANAGLINPVVGIITVVGGGTAFIILKVSLSECEKTEKQELNRLIETTISSQTQFRPIRSNIEVKIQR